MTVRSALLLCIGAMGFAYSPRAQAQSPDPVAESETAGDPVADPAEVDTTKATDEPDEAAKAEPKPWLVGVDLVFGSGDIGAPGAEMGSFSSQSLLLAAAYRLDEGSFALRLPLTAATIDDRATGSSSQKALGNLELSASQLLSSSEALEVPLELALVFPTGSGDPFGNQTAARLAAVQQYAAASRGYEENPLFLPKHFALVPRLGVELHKGIVQVQAHETLEIVLRAGALRPPEPTRANMVGLASVTGVSGFAKLLRDRLALGLRAWATYDLRAVYQVEAPAEGESKLQLAIEPQARGSFGPLQATLGYVAPLGGNLGDANVHGVRLGVAASF